MEKVPKKESISRETMSLVERRRHEALETILNTLSERFPVSLKATFESNGREYTLTSAEDCMVAFAQQNREAVEALYTEIKDKGDYRAEQAIAKLHALFLAYEKTVVLYAELRSYYPTVAARVEEQLPPLAALAVHGSRVWQSVQE